MEKQKKHTLAKGLAIGVGIAAVAAATAGTYFLYGSKNAVKNRKLVKGWMLKAKGEVLEKLEGLSEVSEQVYHKIVREVADKYQAAKNIDKKDIEEFVKELKSHWKSIAKEITAFHKKNPKK